jgi:hypothetical protein
MSNVTLLRKLSLKSKLNFGQYADLSIQEIINLEKKSYLRWVYFNCDKITFFDEILDEIKIPLEFRIEKPNKNPEKYIELNEIIKSKMTGLSKYINEKKKKKYQKVQRKISVSFDKKIFSKDSLRLKNQGK